jgi:hypothetical protein
MEGDAASACAGECDFSTVSFSPLASFGLDRSGMLVTFAAAKPPPLFQIGTYFPFWNQTESGLYFRAQILKTRPARVPCLTPVGLL